MLYTDNHKRIQKTFKSYTFLCRTRLSIKAALQINLPYTLRKWTNRLENLHNTENMGIQVRK